MKKFMRGVIFLISLATVVGSFSSSTVSDSLAPENASSSRDPDDESSESDPDASEISQSGHSSGDAMSSASAGDGQSSEENVTDPEARLRITQPDSPTIMDSPQASVHQSSHATHLTHSHGREHHSSPARVHRSSKASHFKVLSGEDHPIAAREKDDFTGSDEIARLEEDSTDSDDSEPADPATGVVKQLLNHLFGEAIDSFSTSDSLAQLHGSMTVDCTSPAEDGDANFNIVTTLCPFLRPQGPCGRLRHPTYEIADEEAICSTQCRPHINDLIRALPNRQSLSHKHEGVIFRDVVNEILRQYCSICRTGCIL